MIFQWRGVAGAYLHPAARQYDGGVILEWRDRFRSALNSIRQCSVSLNVFFSGGARLEHTSIMPLVYAMGG